MIFYFTIRRKARLLELEIKCRRILKQKEDNMRHKSRVIWVQEGDNNSKFFHEFGNQRRFTNSIWEIKIEKGEISNDQKALRYTIVNHFFSNSILKYGKSTSYYKEFPSLF